MRSFISLLAALAAAAALAGCASRAESARSEAGTATTIEAGAAPAEAYRGDPDAEGPAGRTAGYRVIFFGLQPTYWQVNCPTDSSSPLRKQCSMTRVKPDELP